MDFLGGDADIDIWEYMYHDTSNDIYIFFFFLSVMISKMTLSNIHDTRHVMEA